MQNLLGIYGVLAVAFFGIRWIASAIDRQRMDIYFIVSIVYTFLITALVFGLEFYGLERLEPGSFEGPKHIVAFLGLSFGILLTSADLSPVTAVSPAAIAMTFAALLCSLLIIILLVFVLMTSVWPAILPADASAGRGRSARRIIRRAWRRWSAAAYVRDPAKRRSLISACCSSTKALSYRGETLRCAQEAA